MDDDFQTLKSILRNEMASAPPGPRGDNDRKMAMMGIAGLGILERFVVAIEVLAGANPDNAA